MFSRTRIDTTDWVIHFIHDRKKDIDMYENSSLPFIHFFNEKTGVSIGSSEKADPSSMDVDEEGSTTASLSDSDSSAFGVLNKIVRDGFIRSGWSYRRNKDEKIEPTVYGPFSVVCFTEMPLYALIEYAKARGDSKGYVTSYGIAFKKNELYAAGARKVIDGLSSSIKIVEDPSDSWYGNGLRVLHEQCEIGLHEQYRFVYMNLERESPVDWTHEREWRWPLKDESYHVGGMPFLLQDPTNKCCFPYFSEVVLITNTVDEQTQILDLIKEMLCSDCMAYNQATLKNIGVIALNTLEGTSVDKRTIRIEDIPTELKKRVHVF